jgi:hypothetical protein
MTTQTLDRPQWSAFGQRALIALIAAPAANAIVYVIAAALGAMPESVLVGPMEQPITAVPVIMASLMGAIAGIAVYGALLRFSKQPRRLYFRLAVVVLILALIPTLFISAPVGMILALNVMHVVAAAVIVGALTRS